jgi:SAM-dependent methyltransferase
VRVVFILGSGASVDAGIASVSCITDQVNGGVGVWRHTSGVYVLDGGNPNYELYRPRVVPILRLIADIEHRIAADGHRIALTYEDLALVLQQIGDAPSGEYDNPTVLPFADHLLQRAGLDRDGLRALCDDALDYITDSVAALLHRGRLSDHEHLAAIVDACREVGHVELATLNHDLLLEAALEANGISYADGFEPADHDVRFWTDEWGRATVRVIKLHGSVDWFDFRCRRPTAGWRAARYVGKDPEHPDRPGVELRSPHPTLLSGTFTKILAYQTGHFPDVHVRFHEALRGSDRVVVIATASATRRSTATSSGGSRARR